jgi:hypothetical protein
MTWPPLDRQAHAAFCATENWTPVLNSRERSAHRQTYELRLSDGRILRTRISRPTNRDTYGPSMAQHVLRDQLDVTAEEFWSCVRDGIAPQRGEPRPPAGSLPLDLVHLLIHRVGIPEAEVAQLTREQAIKLINDYWARS